MSHAVFQFGEFTIDPAARELWHAGQRIALPPKSFECLAYLLENRERAVGRDELISAVWGRIDVSDAVLAQTLLRARRAVGDTGTEQTTIRTVPRFGYRWIVSVQSAESSNPSRPLAKAIEPNANDGAPSSDVAPAPALPPPVQPVIALEPDPHLSSAAQASNPIAPSARTRRIQFGIVAALLLLVLAAIGSIALYRRLGRAPLPTGQAVVVMPVLVGDADADSSWIRLGGMDYIAARLREDGKLAVLPSSQIVALVGSLNGEEASDRVAKATGAKWLIQPQAQRMPNGWRITLTVRSDGTAHEATAIAASPLDAAAQASERLLSALNIAHVEHAFSDATPGQLTELLQRIDAALLAGDLTQARRMIETAPAAQRAEPALRVREGQLEFRLGHIDRAERLFTPIADSTSPLAVDVQTQAMMGLGAVAVRRNAFPLAEKRYAEALAALGDHGDPNLVGNAYNGRGVARAAQQHYDLALSDLGRARVTLERAGNQLEAANVEGNLAVTESRRKHYAQAIQHYDRAIAIHERFGVRDSLASDLLNKSRAQLALLDVDGAIASGSKAFQLAGTLENPFLVRAVDAQYARALLAVGRLREAADTLTKLPADTGAQPVDDDVALLGAQIALASGNDDKAFGLLRPLATDAPQKNIDLLPAFVRAALRMQHADLAAQALGAIHDQPASGDERMALELARAELAAAQNDAAGADGHFAKALALADQDGVPADRARAGSAYARFLIAQHQLDKASALIGDLAAYADKDFEVAAATVALYHALRDSALETAARERAKPIIGERRL